jgi:outer membrane protein with beta-barrel domain
MRQLSRCLAVATALALGLGSVASAQGHPQTREGFWIGFGLGWGSFSLKCSGCSGSEGSFSGYLKMGGTLSPKLLLGGETNGWTKSEGGATLTAGNASATMYFYPAPASGFFLRGGLGFASLSAGSGGTTASESGWGFTLGTGYDIRVGAKMSIVPVANFNWGDLGSGVKQNVFQIAVGLTWH